MPIYSKEIIVAATVYIRAETPEAAEKIAQTLKGKCFDGLSGGDEGDVMISGLILSVDKHGVELVDAGGSPK